MLMKYVRPSGSYVEPSATCVGAAPNWYGAADRRNQRRIGEAIVHRRLLVEQVLKPKATLYLSLNRMLAFAENSW